MHIKFWFEHIKERDQSEDFGVDEKAINLRGIGWKGVECIDTTQDSHQWRALVITEMNLRIP
jgi:hypothetical protein